MFALMPKRLLKTLCSEIRLALPTTQLGYSITYLDYSTTSSVDVKFESVDRRNSFTVSYLIESCGLSLETAMTVSEKLELKSQNQPNSVVTLLKDEGFSTAQIAKLVGKHPRILLSSPGKCLLPKLEFLRSVGVPRKVVTKVLSSYPFFFQRSLQNHIVPCFSFLKDIVGTEERVFRCFMNRLSTCNLQRDVIPNLTLLRELQGPKSSISMLVSHSCSTVAMPHKKFTEAVEELKRMGVNPQKSAFPQAIKVWHVLKKSSIEHKFQTYAKWGWSKDDALMAFRVYPNCMVLSDDQIHAKMDFLVNKMGWPSERMAKCCVVLGYSLVKRIMPRCFVIKVLMSMNMVQEDIAFQTFMSIDEVKFRKKYVISFLGDVPQLMDVYEGRIGPFDAGNVSGSGET